MQFRFVVPYRVLIYDHLSQSFPLNHRMCHSLVLASFNVLSLGKWVLNDA